MRDERRKHGRIVAKRGKSECVHHTCARADRRQIHIPHQRVRERSPPHRHVECARHFEIVHVRGASREQSRIVLSTDPRAEQAHARVKQASSEARAISRSVSSVHPYAAAVSAYSWTRSSCINAGSSVLMLTGTP